MPCPGCIKPPPPHLPAVVYVDHNRDTMLVNVCTPQKCCPPPSALKTLHLLNQPVPALTSELCVDHHNAIGINVYHPSPPPATLPPPRPRSLSPGYTLTTQPTTDEHVCHQSTAAARGPPTPRGRGREGAERPSCTPQFIHVRCHVTVPCVCGPPKYQACACAPPICCV
jgi:hypothetical protein